MSDGSSSAELHRSAHELHNHLAAIRMFAELIERELDGLKKGAQGDVAAPIQNDLDQLRLAADSAIQVFHALLADVWRKLDTPSN